MDVYCVTWSKCWFVYPTLRLGCRWFMDSWKRSRAAHCGYVCDTKGKRRLTGATRNHWDCHRGSGGLEWTDFRCLILFDCLICTQPGLSNMSKFHSQSASEIYCRARQAQDVSQSSESVLQASKLTVMTHSKCVANFCVCVWKWKKKSTKSHVIKKQECLDVKWNLLSLLGPAYILSSPQSTNTFTQCSQKMFPCEDLGGTVSVWMFQKYKEHALTVVKAHTKDVGLWD